jgi:peptidoglycan/LPS O-acetylase OafA/YrhL
LDTKFFNFVSRISYGIFLIHGMVIFHINWSNKQDTYLSINNTYVNTLSAIAQSCLLGFITTITV